MIDKTKTVKEICNVLDWKWTKEDYDSSPFPAWDDALMKKTYDEVNLFDVTRMIAQKIYLEVAIPKAIDFLNENPYIGELWDGQLIEGITQLKYTDVIQYKDDFDKILEKARNNLDNYECEFEWERDKLEKIIKKFDYEKIKITDGKSKDINWQRRSDRFASLSLDIQEECQKNRKKTKQLLKIKTNETNPKIGDIFLVNPNLGLYFWGAVVDLYYNIYQKKNCLVIFIFKEKVTSLNKQKFIFDLNNLLFEPMYVSLDYWEKGYLYKINHIDLSNISIDFGFFKHPDRVYLDKNLNVVENPPAFIVTNTIYTNDLLAKYIQEELIIDKSLAECDETLKLI